MENERMLAYQMAQKLTDAEIEDAISGGGHVTQFGPTKHPGGVVMLDGGWDL